MSTRSHALSRIALRLALCPALLVASCSGGGGGSPQPAPTLLSVEPVAGPSIAGTPITLRGTGFDSGLNSVRVRGAQASDLVVIDDTTATATTPVNAPGPADILVRTAGGTATLPDAFEYYAVPLLSSVAPDSGFVSGGATLEVSGAGFVANGAGQNSATLGGAPAVDVVVHSDTRIELETPGGIAGPADLAVTNANGSGVLTDRFTYFGLPPSFTTADARLDSDDAGTAVSGPTRLACDGDNVYVVWSDRRDGKADIYFNRSTNRGASWLATDVRLDTDAAGAFESAEPRIACQGDSVFVVWTDLRNNPINSIADIYFNRSLDGGATWLPADVRLDTDAAGSATSAAPWLASWGAEVYVVWEDSRNGSPTFPFDRDIYFNRSDDAGATWLASDLRLDSDAPGASDSATARIHADGSGVYVVWSDRRNDPIENIADIYFDRSTDGGLTWLPADVRLDTDPSGDANSFHPVIAGSGPALFVAWDDRRNDPGGSRADIYFTRSLDGGATWLASDVRLDTDTPGASDSSTPLLASHGSSVYAAWTDGRHSAGGIETDIYFNRSTDAGDSWLASDVRLDRDAPGNAASSRPQLACHAQNVFVVWDDVRNDPAGLRPDIYLNLSTDGGVTWQASDVRVDTDAAGAAGSFAPQLCSEGARAVVVWHDFRNGDSDVYVNRLVP